MLFSLRWHCSYLNGLDPLFLVYLILLGEDWHLWQLMYKVRCLNLENVVIAALCL